MLFTRKKKQTLKFILNIRKENDFLFCLNKLSSFNEEKHFRYISILTATLNHREKPNGSRSQESRWLACFQSVG